MTTVVFDVTSAAVDRLALVTGTFELPKHRLASGSSMRAPDEVAMRSFTKGQDGRTW
jgi:hypothetical protein